MARFWVGDKGIADLPSRDAPERRRGPRPAWSKQVIRVKGDTTDMEGRSGGRCRPQVSRNSRDWATGGQWQWAGPWGRAQTGGHHGQQSESRFPSDEQWLRAGIKHPLANTGVLAGVARLEVNI